MKLLKFYTDTCQPCRLMAPVVKSACAKVGIEYENVDAITDDRALKYNIAGVPALILEKDGVEVDRKVGLIPLKNLIGWLEKYAI